MFAEVNDEISRLKEVIKRGQTHISNLEKSNEHLTSELKLINEEIISTNSEVETVVKERFVRIPRDKVASNTYERKSTTNVISKQPLKAKSKPRIIRTQRTDNIQNLNVKKDSTTQYLDYLEKIKRK